MLQIIEFPVPPEWIKNPDNNPLATIQARLGAAARTKLCIATIHRVLDAHLTRPLRSVVSPTGREERNLWTVWLVRISTGRVDPVTGGASMKAVQDALARWAGEPSEQAPIWRWIEPIGQESRGYQRIGEERRAITRVRIELMSLDFGEDRRIELNTIDQHIQAAKAELRRLAKDRDLAKALDPERSRREASLAARARAEATFAKLTGRDAAQAERDRANADMRQRIARSDAIGRDPGEERRPSDLKSCMSCGAAIGEPCARQGSERLVYGVHESRARAAGLRVARKEAPRPVGPRRVVPAAEIPEPRAYVALPWAPRQAYHERRLDPLAARGELAASVRVTVPPEHRERYGQEVELYLRKISAGGRRLWMYSKKGT